MGCAAVEILLIAFLCGTYAYVLHCWAIIHRFRKRCDADLSQARCQTVPKCSWMILVVVQSAFKFLPTPFCVEVSILISIIFFSVASYVLLSLTMDHPSCLCCLQKHYYSTHLHISVLSSISSSRKISVDFKKSRIQSCWNSTGRKLISSHQGFTVLTSTHSHAIETFCFLMLTVL